jgi:hypothetical protein
VTSGAARARGRRVAATAATLVVGITAMSVGCFDRRGRLDVPRISLVVDDSIVAPGGTVRGRAWAVDESGIIFLLVTVFTADSAARTQLNRVAADSVDLAFALPVASDSPADAVVSVRALARDNQDFEVSVTDTVFVRTAPPAP